MAIHEDEQDDLGSLRAHRQVVRDAVGAHYGEAFDLLEVEIGLAADIGQLALHHQDEHAQTPATFASIARLHAAVVLTASEVIELLRAGYAAGATGRWRTLYERAVIGHFISKAGEETAVRYLEHGAIQLCKVASALETAERGLMQTRGQLKRLRARSSELTQKYGSGFAGDYGWAGLALSGRPSDKGSFAELEKQTPSAEDRILYRTASQEVHSATYGPVIGAVRYAPEMLLLGPTPYQLAGTGQLTAKWVYLSAAALVAHASGPRQLGGLAARCKELAEEAHEMLDEAERDVGDILEESLAAFVAPPPREAIDRPGFGVE